MRNKSIFSERIKELRESLSMSQAEFAESVETSQTTLSSYENTNKTPSLHIVLRIAQTYNVSIDWLCGLSDAKSRSTVPKTLADVLRYLFAIEQCCELDIFSNEEIIDTNKNLDGPNFQPQSLHEIAFLDTKMNEFIWEWKKILPLYRNQTFDGDLYQLWTEKMLKKAEDYRADGFPMCFVDVDKPPTTE